MAKIYSKLLKNSIMIPVLMLALLMLSAKYSQYKESENKITADMKSEVLIINRDSGSELTNSLIKYLSRYCRLVISDSSDAYLDYLSNVQYDYILDIPQYYQKDFMQGNKPVIGLSETGKKEVLPLKYMLEGYLTAAQQCISDNSSISARDLAKKLDTAMDRGVSLSFEEKDRDSQNNVYIENFFKAAAYIMVFLYFFAIGRISGFFGLSGIRKKHEIAPISAGKNSLRLFLSNFIFVLCGDGIIFLLFFLLNPEIVIGWKIIFSMLNFFVYSICVLGICYILSALALKPEINIILILFYTSIMAFFNGDLFYSNKSGLINVAEFTPVYWLKNINNEIVSIPHFSWSAIYRILYMLGVNALIAGAYFSLSLVINKNRVQSK